MSLNFDLSNIPFARRSTEVTDPEEIARLKNTHALFPRPVYDTEDGFFVMNVVTQALIWLTVAIDMGQITEKNWREFYLRVHAEETLFGARCAFEEGPYFITPQDVKDHIGLRTNVTTRTKSQWWKKVLEQFEERVAREVADAGLEE